MIWDIQMYTHLSLCVCLLPFLSFLFLSFTLTRAGTATHTHTHTHTERLIGCRENICCFFFSVLYEVLTPSVRSRSLCFVTLSILISQKTPERTCHLSLSFCFNIKRSVCVCKGDLCVCVCVCVCESAYSTLTHR